MPPVLGPVSPSPTGLWSWLDGMSSTSRPSQKARNEASSPTRQSSMTTRSPAEEKGLSDHHAFQGRLGLVQGLADHHALARGQTVGLDHHGRAALGQMGPGLAVVVEDREIRGGHPGLVHDGLGEGPWTLPAGPRRCPGRKRPRPPGRCSPAGPAPAGPRVRPPPDRLRSRARRRSERGCRHRPGARSRPPWPCRRCPGRCKAWSDAGSGRSSRPGRVPCRRNRR